MKGKSICLNGIVLSILIGVVACSSEKDPDPAIDCGVSGLAIQVVQATEVEDCSAQNGVIEVTATGGEGDKQFTLNDGGPQASGTFQGLAPGTYTLGTVDANGCTAQVEVALSVLNSDLGISGITSSESGCTTSNASLTVTAGGSGTLEYRLDDGAFQTSNEFNGLPAGNYTITVRDADCETTSLHQVRSGVSYSSQVEQVITSRCSTPGCHDGSIGASRNWTVFANVQNRAAGIRTRTQNGSMPPEDSTPLTQEERDLIACWVDDGALAN